MRGLVADDPNKGQVMWRADFRDCAVFQQQLRSMGSPCAPMAFQGWGETLSDSNPFAGFFGNDDHYLSHGSQGWGHSNYRYTMVINWTMRSSAVLTSSSRKGFGVPIEIGVFAQGTAVAQYYRDQDDDDSIGVLCPWNHDTHEFVDFCQFAVLDASTKLPLLHNGAPCVFTVPGSGSDWNQAENYSSQYFTVSQEGGFFVNGPKVITTHAGVDPLLALLMGHLCTREFSSESITNNFCPDFPLDPSTGVNYGFLAEVSLDALAGAVGGGGDTVTSFDGSGDGDGDDDGDDNLFSGGDDDDGDDDDDDDDDGD